MSSFALLLAAFAWLVACALLLPGVGLPAPLSTIVGILGAIALAALALRRRDPRHRSDPVSRIEARRRARARYEDDRVRRLRRQRASSIERHDREAQERVETRIRELVERRSRPPADPASSGAMWQDPGLGLAVPGNRAASLDPVEVRPAPRPGAATPGGEGDPDRVEGPDGGATTESVDALLAAPLAAADRGGVATPDVEWDELARRRQDEVDAARVARARAADAARAREAEAERRAGELAAAREAAAREAAGLDAPGWPTEPEDAGRSAMEQDAAAWRAVGPGVREDEDAWLVADDDRWEPVGPGAPDPDEVIVDEPWADGLNPPARAGDAARRDGGRSDGPRRA